jgi:hypothetical protein
MNNKLKHIGYKPYIFENYYCINWPIGMLKKMKHLKTRI